MLILQSPQVLQVVLSGAVTTNQLPIVASYMDAKSPAAGATINTVTNGATAVTAVSTPAGGVSRQVSTLSVQNKDTAAATVTVQFYDGTNTRQIIVATLQINESMVYDDGGFIVLDANGQWKTNNPASSGAGSTALSAQVSVSTIQSSNLSTLTVAASQALSAATSVSTIQSSNLSTLTVAASQALSAAVSVSANTSTVLSRVSSGGH